MGYDLAIGEAVIQDINDIDEPTYEARLRYGRPSWITTVDRVSLPDAPVFPGDGVNQGDNMRSPSYSQWADFAEQTGLTDLFYNEQTGFLSSHPGCMPIYEEDWRCIHAVAKQWFATHGKEPGWNAVPILGMEGGELIGAGPNLVAIMMGEPASTEGPYDPIYARLVWLDFWMRWALDNCERPAFCNW